MRENTDTQRTFTDTGRTALFGGGREEKIFETWTVGGPFAGATFEVLESDLPEDAVIEVPAWLAEARAN